MGLEPTTFCMARSILQATRSDTSRQTRMAEYVSSRALPLCQEPHG
jgi:hypothetical protein